MNNRNKKKVKKGEERKLIKNNKAIVVPGCVEGEEGKKKRYASGWVLAGILNDILQKGHFNFIH